MRSGREKIIPLKTGHRRWIPWKIKLPVVKKLLVWRKHDYCLSLLVQEKAVLIYQGKKCSVSVWSEEPGNLTVIGTKKDSNETTFFWHKKKGHSTGTKILFRDTLSLISRFKNCKICQKWKGWWFKNILMNKVFFEKTLFCIILQLLPTVLPRFFVCLFVCFGF